MLSNDIVKQNFIIDTVSAGLNKVQQVQMSIALGASDKVRKKFDMDQIYNDIRSRSLNVYGATGHYMFSLDIVKKLRFSDMRKLGNLKIYNKRVWGQLYVDTLPVLQNGITENLSTAIGDELQQDGNPLTSIK